ncbi:MAG: GreA/GreB family elongation factor [bacterium]|nr:GreA/GreB family elongation factor [bacterium]
MSETEEFVFTRAGYEELRRELEELEAKAPEMQEYMRSVRDDNEIAGMEPSMFEAYTDLNRYNERVKHLKFVLERAAIIDEDPDPHTASPGDRVTVVDLETNEQLDFDLLGGMEVANGRHGVSIESPVGQALLGKRKGATIEVEVPDGIARYKIVALGEIPVNQEDQS